MHQQQGKFLDHQLIQQQDNLSERLNSTNKDSFCSTFFGLFKNEIIKQYDENTISTAWNQAQIPLSQKSCIKNDHNQKINQNSSQSQTITIQQLKSNEIITQNIKKFNDKFTQNQKKILISKRNSKIKRLKDILPYFYITHLPKKYKKILIIAEKIDIYLIQKRKSNFYIDNVFNIFRKLFDGQQMSILWTEIRRIMFIQEDYYKINIDPMKNLTLGIFNKKDTKIYQRKQRLRKALVDYIISFKTSPQQEERVPQIPQNLINPTKITKFYLENMDLISNKTTQQQQLNKIKPQFIKSLKQTVINREEQLNLKKESSNTNDLINSSYISLYQFSEFCNTIQQIYSNRKVKNMYKVSLIDCLRKTEKFQINKIFKMIKLILKEQLFIEVLIKSNCQIFHIITDEKHQLIEFFKEKRQNQI